MQKITHISFQKLPKHADFSECGMELAELFVKAGLAKSKTEFRNGVKNGGFRVQDRKITDPFARASIFENFLVILEHE